MWNYVTVSKWASFTCNIVWFSFHSLAHKISLLVRHNLQSISSEVSAGHPEKVLLSLLRNMFIASKHHKQIAFNSAQIFAVDDLGNHVSKNSGMFVGQIVSRVWNTNKHCSCFWSGLVSRRLSPPLHVSVRNTSVLQYTPQAPQQTYSLMCEI